MPTDIRVLTEDDVERWTAVERTAFMSPHDDSARYIAMMKPEWTLGAFEDGVLQAFVISAPMALGLEGARLRMGGVSSVASMPEARRRGLIAALLRETLRRSREIGDVLSGLWTPHPALYRRYGWEICTDSINLRFNPKHIELPQGPKPPGRVERLGADDWRFVEGSYREWAARRNSVLLRDEWRWRMIFLFPGRETFIYRGPDGRVEGHALLRTTGSGDDRVLEVGELIANTAPAYRALLELLLSFDLVKTVTWWVGADEPVLEAVANPEQIKGERHYGLFVRLVDLAEAFSQRPAYADGRVVVRVVDEACPWNDGVWEIVSAGAHFAVERCSEEPMLTVDARGLAQLYNGYRSATNLARAGRIEAHHPRALAVADILLAMRTPPFCLDEF
ncbi:MAG TPA: GNAT family N-acetyltransferase [Dehalococcoidia bacterium]|nr:GNAT family N-acetyltransferase [Dehalococcoidia bacterium]